VCQGSEKSDEIVATFLKQLKAQDVASLQSLIELLDDDGMCIGLVILPEY
jgi:hypothetical protein